MPKKNPKHTKSYQMRRLSDLLRYEGPSWEGQNKQEIIENYIFSKFTENLFPAKGEERKTWTPDLKTIYVDYLGLNNVPEKEQIETRISIFPTQRPIFEWFFKFIVLNEFSNLFKLVRKSHVKTDKHWTKNWKASKLTNYGKYKWYNYSYLNR